MSIVQPAWLHVLWDSGSFIVSGVAISPQAKDPAAASWLLANAFGFHVPELETAFDLDLERSPWPSHIRAAPLLVELPWASTDLHSAVRSAAALLGIQWVSSTALEADKMLQLGAAIRAEILACEAKPEDDASLAADSHDSEDTECVWPVKDLLIEVQSALGW
ncbi:MAG: hypothetical protein ABIW79_05765 [Gemmatimonas sp.]